MDSMVVNEIANIGLTILGIVAIVILVKWLDRNIFNKGRFGND